MSDNTNSQQNTESITVPLSNTLASHDKIDNLIDDPVLLSKTTFKNAENFLKASKLLPLLDLSLTSVAIMNLALACELYLKSLIFYTRSDAKRVSKHQLYHLYQMLPEEYQTSIRALYETRYKCRDNFDQLFQEVSDTFIYARYLNERKSSSLSTELYNLTFAIRECAKQLHNSLIRKDNDAELALYEKLKQENRIDSLLFFYLYHAPSGLQHLEAITKEIVGQLSPALKQDFDHSEFIEKDEYSSNTPAIVLYFARDGYSYTKEYDSISNTASAVFTKYGLSMRGIRTNGHIISLVDEVK